MTDTRELAGLDPFALFDTEVERTYGHLRSLTGDDWSRPTRCEGWRNREMLSHLRGVELYNRACVEEAIPALMARASEEGGVSDVDSFNAWLIDVYAGAPTESLLEEWHNEALWWRSQLAERGEEAMLTTMAGPYPIRLQVFHLAQEYATHADDMGAAVAPGEADARSDWRARFTIVALDELGKDVRVERTGDRVLAQAGDAQAELTLSDFVEAGQGRLAPGTLPDELDGALRANG